MSTVAERIIQIVDDNGGNMSAFARDIGVTPAYISKLKNEPDRIPSDRTIADICRVFQINEVWLRTGKGDMYSATAKSDAILTTLASALGPTNSEQDRFIRAVAQIPREYIVPISQAALTIARAMYPDLFTSEPATQPDSKADPEAVHQDAAGPTGSIPPPD